MRFLIVCIFLILLSCKQKEAVSEVIHEENVIVNVEEKMLGEWNNTLMHITYDIGTDSMRDYSITKATMAEKMKLSNIEYRMYEDGRFYSEFVLLDGSILKSESTNWYVNGDSAYITQTPYNETLTIAYGYEANGDDYTLKAIHDWDNDGNRDDLMILEFVKVKQ